MVVLLIDSRTDVHSRMILGIWREKLLQFLVIVLSMTLVCLVSFTLSGPAVPDAPDHYKCKKCHPEDSEFRAVYIYFCPSPSR